MTSYMIAGKSINNEPEDRGENIQVIHQGEGMSIHQNNQNLKQKRKSVPREGLHKSHSMSSKISDEITPHSISMLGGIAQNAGYSSNKKTSDLPIKMDTLPLRDVDTEEK